MEEKLYKIRTRTPELGFRDVEGWCPECIGFGDLIFRRNRDVSQESGHYSCVATAFTWSFTIFDSQMKLIKDDEIGDPVNHPDHYGKHPSGVESIEIVEEFGFLVGNAMKYLWRHEHKGKPIEDLEKAVWYIQRNIDKLKDEN